MSRARTRRSTIRRDALDALFSRYVRVRDDWTCQRCGTPYPVGAQGLHCAHIFGRRMASVRFDPDNAVALCYGCHQWVTEHPLLFMQWAQRRLGHDRYARLLVRSHLTAKQAGVDRVAVRVSLEQQLKELQP